MANHLRISLLAAVAAVSMGLGGQVVDEDGKPVAAIVWVDAPSGEKTPSPKTVEVRQRDKKFVPRLIAAEVGQAVQFPNDDHVFHNVFSAAKGNAFDLGLFKAGAKYDEATLSKVDKGPESGLVRFKAPGRVDVFCNIHPAMSAVIVVVPHRHYARSGEDGSFTIASIPKGASKLKAVDEEGNEAEAAIGSGPVKLIFKNRKSGTPEHLNKEGKPYNEGSKAY